MAPNFEEKELARTELSECENERISPQESYKAKLTDCECHRIYLDKWLTVLHLHKNNLLHIANPTLLL